MYVDYLIRHWREIMWGSILSFFSMFYLFSCHGHPKIVTPNFNKQFTHQLSNFTFLVKEVNLTFCDEVDKELGTCDEVVFPESSASGVVISQSQSHLFILTANHFCVDTPPEQEAPMEGERIIQVYIGHTKRDAKVVMDDKDNDLCLLEALKFKKENFKPVIFASEMPKIGEKLYNFAAPDGIGSPNTRLMFDGYFAGCEQGFCMYSIPATFGSSGSAVYNEKGELVSILVAAAIDFESVSMGPDISKITNFVKSIDKVVDIY
jgi:S1-C subfamily serine protease|tara:strand:- start:7110 stop:7898 length:789 start_codon:yes stop_codon:yes gene_type:complete